MPRAVYHSEDESENVSGAIESGGDGSKTASGDTEGEDQSGTEWLFNWELGLVVHDVNRCRMCDEFVVHYCDAQIRLHPSYRTARSAREVAMTRAVKERIDARQSQLGGLKYHIPRLQRLLEGVRQEMKTTRVHLEEVRHALGEVRRVLDEARRGRTAASGSKSSQRQRPRPSRSPSPRPSKLPRHASE